MIKVGDTVKVKGNYSRSMRGMIGRVVADRGEDLVTVKFTGWSEGHHGDMDDQESREYWNIPISNLSLIKPKNIKWL